MTQVKKLIQIPYKTELFKNPKKKKDRKHPRSNRTRSNSNSPKNQSNSNDPDGRKGRRTSDAVVIGTSGDRAGDDGERVEGLAGDGQRHADADGGSGSSIEAKYNIRIVFSVERHFHLKIPNLSIPIPLHRDGREKTVSAREYLTEMDTRIVKIGEREMILAMCLNYGRPYKKRKEH